jgi:hypothetical protein
VRVPSQHLIKRGFICIPGGIFEDQYVRGQEVRERRVFTQHIHNKGRICLVMFQHFEYDAECVAALCRETVVRVHTKKLESMDHSPLSITEILSFHRAINFYDRLRDARL